MSGEFPEHVSHELPPDVRAAVVAARFNEPIVSRLLTSCLGRLGELGIDAARVEVHRVPGAFELPLAAQSLARTGRFRAVICLGCVVRGETPHFDYVAAEAARGIARVALDERLPVIFGVLTTKTLEQAQARSGGRHGDAGRRAAEAAVEMAAMMRAVGPAL